MSLSLNNKLEKEREILKYWVNMSRQVGNPADNRKIFSEIMCQNDIIDRAERWNLVRGEKHDIKTDGYGS